MLMTWTTGDSPGQGSKFTIYYLRQKTRQLFFNYRMGCFNNLT